MTPPNDQSESLESPEEKYLRKAITDLRTQLAAAQRERDEAKRSAEFWMGKECQLRRSIAEQEKDLDQSNAERDQLRAEVARLTSALDTLTQEREEFIRYCQSIQLASGEVGPIQVARMHIERLASQVAELQRDRERLEKLVPFFLRVDEDTCRASIHMGTLAVTFKEGDTLRSAIDAMRAKGAA